MLIITAIDIMGGRCVRLALGNFDDVTTYGDPVEQCAAFAATGAEWVHVVDLDGAREGKPMQHDLVRALTGGSAKIKVGGGVRTAEQVETLLEAGVSRVVIGSLAVQRPEQVRDWIASFGAERICCAFDVRPAGADFDVVVNGWTASGGVSLSAALAFYEASDLRHILVTDISRDGVLAGPNVALMQKVREQHHDLAIQVSGGVSSLDDLKALRQCGLESVIVGRALYERRFTLEDALAL